LHRGFSVYDTKTDVELTRLLKYAAVIHAWCLWHGAAGLLVVSLPLRVKKNPPDKDVGCVSKPSCC